ncbi:MAG: HAMP domain-containing histidine kinase [Clostridia bacterium]|nr:HAMP domain-containing histidine kinase [Clostridia bacterium]
MSLSKKSFIINAVFVILVTAILITAFVFTGGAVVSSDIETRLVKTVKEKAAEVYESDGDLTDIDFFPFGINVSVYDLDGNYVGGYLIQDEFDGGFEGSFDGGFEGEPSRNAEEGEQPSDRADFFEGGFPPDMRGDEMRGGMVRKLDINGKEYFAYECKVFLKSGVVYSVRGLTSKESAPINKLMIVACVAAGLLALIALVLSYFSLRNATKPIRDMTAALDAVENSSDLGKRVELDTKYEEIRNLCDSYNRMLERLEDILKSQERFTSDVSHELRSPLTVLLAESEFALNDLTTVEEKDKSLEAIYAQTKRLTVMVRQLLEFSRVANTESVALTDTDISVLTREIAESVDNAKNVTVSCDVTDGIVIKTDETLYIRMVTNLIDNAVKYNSDGGNVWVKLSFDENKVVLSVEDDGIGMSEDTLKHIYERMYQADKSRSDGSGLGLGLSFVKEISRILGSTVEVTSSLGKGSRFTVTFPVK